MLCFQKALANVKQSEGRVIAAEGRVWRGRVLIGGCVGRYGVERCGVGGGGVKGGGVGGCGVRAYDVGGCGVRGGGVRDDGMG